MSEKLDTRRTIRFTEKEIEKMGELVDYFSVDESKLIRAALKVVYDNRHLIDDFEQFDVEEVRDDFDPEKDNFSSANFINTFVKDGQLKLDITISWDDGMITLSPGIRVEQLDKEILLFHVTDNDDFYFNIERIATVKIVDPEEDKDFDYFYKPYNKYPKSSFFFIKCW